jgi:putative DNA-invertase from lambdoid prophage Rac
MIQSEKRAVIYCRVSTDDQNCQRQLRDLGTFAKRAKYKVAGIFQETASGAKSDRIERAKILKLAQARKIDAILVTELTRWGRSTIDLLQTLEQLNKWNVSVIAQTGSQFDLSSAQGKMIAGVLSVLSQFERDLISERTKSGLQAAVARGKKLGRQPGQNPSDKYASEVLEHIADGRSYRWIAHEMQVSPTTVMAIVRRNKKSKAKPRALAA